MYEKINLAKADAGPADVQSAAAGRKAGRKPLRAIRPPGPVLAAFVELAHKLAGWVPARPASLKLGDSVKVAKHFIWLAYAGRAPGDEREFKRARGLTADQLGIGERTVETHIARARNVDGFWNVACRLARKNKADKLAKL